MALRSGPALTVAITGPRSSAVGAPQWIGKREGAPAPGCEVRRMWDERFMKCADRASEAEGLRAFLPARDLQNVNLAPERRLYKRAVPSGAGPPGLRNGAWSAAGWFRWRRCLR